MIKEELNKVKEYQDHIEECIEQQAYQTASMYAQNLAKYLKQFHEGNIRWCDEHECFEEK